jgi:spore germination cell wall hydrolase CwlJ-like protein
MISLQEMLVLMGIATTPSVADVPVVKPDILLKRQQEEISCMADNIYFEARNQGTAGWSAVASVTLNRVNDKRFPNTVCEVVKQGPTRESWKQNGEFYPLKHRCQFSFWCDGKPEVMRDETAKQWAYNVAESTLQGIFYDTTSGATHYHADYVVPDWSKNSMFTKTVQINAHIFYRWEN